MSSAGRLSSGMNEGSYGTMSSSGLGEVSSRERFLDEELRMMGGEFTVLYQRLDPGHSHGRLAAQSSSCQA